MLEAYQYILFDLDGTLTDSQEGICKSVQYALADAGITEENPDVLESFIGPPLKQSFMEIYGMDNGQAEQAVDKYRERFAVTGLYENKLYPGILSLLERLRAKGKHLAVASGKPTVFVERILDYFGIRDYFEVVIGSELDGRRGTKEEVIREVLTQEFHVPSNDYDKCVMIGDRRFDIEGALAFGIPAIGVLYGYGSKEELETAGGNVFAGSVTLLEQLLLPSDARVQNSDVRALDSGVHVQGACSKENLRHRRVHSFYQVWQILFPILLYWMIGYVVTLVGVMAVNSYFAAKGTLITDLSALRIAQISVYLNTLAMACTIPVLLHIFKKDGETSGIFQCLKIKQKSLLCVLSVIFGISLALGGNILISYVDFSAFSQTYQKVGSVQYSVPLLAGLFIYGVVAPIAEELLFRGIVYRRLVHHFTPSIGLAISALMFGFYHGNLVQGIYGFLLGLALAWCYQKFGSIWIPILFHSAANISVFAITSNVSAQAAINRPINGIIFLGIAGLTYLQLSRQKCT